LNKDGRYRPARGGATNRLVPRKETAAGRVTKSIRRHLFAGKPMLGCAGASRRGNWWRKQRWRSSARRWRKSTRDRTASAIGRDWRDLRVFRYSLLHPLKPPVLAAVLGVQNIHPRL